MATDVLRYSAFTVDGAGGNPAGVVLDATGLSEEQMLAIAAEVGYSETAFVIPDSGSDGRLRVRYFSPLAEVAFCGHATIATAVALADRDGLGQFDLVTDAGLVTVTTAERDGTVTAELVSPPASTRPADEEEVAAALRTFGWSRQVLDPRYPVHVANAGVNHLVLAVDTRERLAEMAYDFPALQALMARAGWTTVQVVWAESPTIFHARNPFPPGGVVEDPATGAAAAAFGGYLRALDLVPVPGDVTILQGQDMGRPSRLLVGLDPSSGPAPVRVAGAAAMLT